jgi:hypothetical protein
MRLKENPSNQNKSKISIFKSGIEMLKGADIITDKPGKIYYETPRGDTRRASSGHNSQMKQEGSFNLKNGRSPHTPDTSKFQEESVVLVSFSQTRPIH